MASIVYHSFVRNVLTGTIDCDTDTFKGMLVNSTYAAIADSTKKDSHDYRNDVTANEVSGTGYTAGGTAVTVTVDSIDTANDRVELTFSNPSWASSTITASGIVVYKSRGGADTADELVAFGDFGGSVSSTAATFSVTFSSKLRFQN